ncbi:MAG: DUF4124 domain-containing protein [Thiobacillus sp.]|nr:DUF4124 domain-containing protein [Thiobacillus sp.]
MSTPARALLVLILTLNAPSAWAQATLNKCIDARGLVTYTNKPCVNAQEMRKLEIDPAPVPDQPRPEVPTNKPLMPAIEMSKPSGSVQIETRKTVAGKPVVEKSAGGQCDILSDQLGRVLDKMDQARRKGYTQAQMDKWNEQTRELERKKQQSACF